MASPEPPKARKDMRITHPTTGNIFKVGETFTVKAKIMNEKLKKKDPKVTIYIQKNVRYPLVNDRLDNNRVHAHVLRSKEGFKVKVLAKWIIDSQVNVGYRIRIGWKANGGGYVDSRPFKIVK
jgi:hypothetical protein